MFRSDKGLIPESLTKIFQNTPKMLKNVNAVFIGDFRGFAAGDVSCLRRQSFDL